MCPTFALRLALPTNDHREQPDRLRLDLYLASNLRAGHAGKCYAEAAALVEPHRSTNESDLESSVAEFHGLCIRRLITEHHRNRLPFLDGRPTAICDERVVTSNCAQKKEQGGWSDG